MIQTVDVSEIHVIDSESSDSSEKYPKHSTPIKDKSKQQFSQSTKKKNPHKVNIAGIPARVISPNKKQTLNPNQSLSSNPEFHQSVLSSSNPKSQFSSSNTKSQLGSPNAKQHNISGDDSISKAQGPNPLERSTIQKQRQEIQLLVAELRERDQELNEMVAAHQRQLLSWEQDRTKIVHLEQKCRKYKNELLNRTTKLNKVTTQLQDLETKCSSQLETSTEKLTQLIEEREVKSNLLFNLEDRNKSLNDSLKEVSCTVGQMAAREQEIITMLKLKDQELVELDKRFQELAGRYQHLEKRNSQCHSRERDAFDQSSHWQQKYNQSLHELKKLDIDVRERDEVLNQQISQINEAQHHMIALQEALIVSNEQEKCKDELLTSLKNKQERTVSELRSLRELYERQQRELTLLQMNLNTSQMTERSDFNTSNDFDISQTDPNIPELDQSNYSEMTSHHTLTNRISFDDRLHRFLDLDSVNLPASHYSGDTDTVEVTRPHNQPSSPGSKLQRLIMESKNMLDSLERSRSLSPAPKSETPPLYIQSNTESKTNREVSEKPSEPD